jgi:hypothetical protein
MVNLNKRTKIIIGSIAIVAVLLAIALPIAGAEIATNTVASNLKIFNSEGKIYQTIDSSTIKYYSADLTLTLQPTTTDGNVKKFDVTSGTLVANGITYTFTSGRGAVLTGRHLILLEAQGAASNEQNLTLKIAGRYSYSWLNNQVVVKIGARLITADGNFTLLMKSIIPT